MFALRPNQSIDEKTIGVQGRHADEMKIKHKREGNGFMVDCWCDDGFTCSFHFKNMPAPIKYLRLKLSPLYGRVLGLFDTLLCQN